VCEGWLRPGGTFCVPGMQAGVYRRVFLAARPGMTALPVNTEETRHAHTSARQFCPGRRNVKLGRRNPRRTGGAVHRWI
jgi:hypothetical protein